MFKKNTKLCLMYSISIFCIHSHTVGLWQATHGSMFGQEAILQVDHRLSDLLIFGQHIVVVQHHSQVLLYWQGTSKLKHPGKEKAKQKKCENRCTLD